MSDKLSNVDPAALIEFAREFQSKILDVQDITDNLMNGYFPGIKYCNPDTNLPEALEFLETLNNPAVDRIIREYYEWEKSNG